MRTVSGIQRPRRLAWLALLVPALLATPSCLTSAMWESLDDTRTHRVEAVLLTPVTVAVDVALIAGCVYVLSRAGGGCGCGSSSPGIAPERMHVEEALDRAKWRRRW